MICVRAQKKLKILVLLTLYYYFYSRLNYKSKNNYFINNLIIQLL